MEYAFAAMMGWCGTKWPGWWRGPNPGPEPEPWWRIVQGVVGAIGGIVAWVVFGPMIGEAGGLITTAIVCFFGGNFLGSLAEAAGIGAKRAGITTPS